MIYLRWLLSSALDLLMVPVWYLGAPIVSLFTEAMEDTDEELERWGGWFGTYDNPPQGDEKHQIEGVVHLFLITKQSKMLCLI